VWHKKDPSLLKEQIKWSLCESQEAIKWGSSSDEIGKTEAPCHLQQVWYDKDSFLLKGPERRT
jgi:hypothetical protein